MSIANDSPYKISKAAGEWFSKVDPKELWKKRDYLGKEFKHLDIKEILRKRLNLPELNKVESYVEIKIPAGQKLRMGIIGRSKSGTGGEIQYQIISGQIKEDWIADTLKVGDIMLKGN